MPPEKTTSLYELRWKRGLCVAGCVDPAYGNPGRVAPASRGLTGTKGRATRITSFMSFFPFRPVFLPR